MKRHSIASLAGVAALLASPAQATPPDIVSAGDELFAATPDTVFVLRGTRDNLGQYVGSHSETFLVAIDVATGEETWWLVYRVKETIHFDSSAGARAGTEMLVRNDWHDPYAIVADAGAMLEAGGKAEPIASPANGETYTIAYDEGRTFTFSRVDLLAQLERSRAVLVDSVDDFERMAPISTRELYRMLPIDPDFCSFAKLGRPIGVNTAAYQLIRIDCADEEQVGGISFIQAIPPDDALMFRVEVPVPPVEGAGGAEPAE